ncbi:hypothetical protein KZ326_08545 [Glaesserella parasuis]|nr:hypothetical protein [Glaesserella parasuis]
MRVMTVKKLAYTYIHPIWQAPSGKQYQIVRYELRRLCQLFVDGVMVLSHDESDVLLLQVLKSEMGWSGNLKKPLTSQDKANICTLAQAFCLDYQGIFVK